MIQNVMESELDNSIKLLKAYCKLT